MERQESAVCAVSFAVTGDRGVSEEVAQDAFLPRLKAWACGIARNLARKARATHARLVAETSEPADTGCLAITPHKKEGSLDCRTIELAEDELKVINFGSK